MDRAAIFRDAMLQSMRYPNQGDIPTRSHRVRPMEGSTLRMNSLVTLLAQTLSSSN